MPRSTKTKGDRRTKVSRHGTPLDDAHCVKLRYNESISSFIAKVGGNCVAHERYSDGTLYFSGTVGGEQAAQLKVTAKPGWKPEIRRSRTLSLFVKTEEGVAAPAMSVEDAVDLVRQSCLREALPVIELVRVANTHSKTSHVFVQFEGETLARSFVNKVDAMPYVHRETGKLVHVHASQLNKCYEYEPPTGASQDPLVWYNPEYVGKRCVTVVSRDMSLTGATLLDAADVLLGVELRGALVQSVRRVALQSAVHFVIEAPTRGCAAQLLDALAPGLPKMLRRVEVLRRCSRKAEDEAADQLVFCSRRAARNAAADAHTPASRSVSPALTVRSSLPDGLLSASRLSPTLVSAESVSGSSDYLDDSSLLHLCDKGDLPSVASVCGSVCGDEHSDLPAERTAYAFEMLEYFFM